MRQNVNLQSELLKSINGDKSAGLAHFTGFLGDYTVSCAAGKAEFKLDKGEGEIIVALK